MIGFIAAISSALAMIILVVISSLITFIQSILPDAGIIQINENKYRFVMEEVYITPTLMREVMIQVDLLKVSDRVSFYQTGCSYGFNINKRQMTEISTYNHIILGQYFAGSVDIKPIYLYKEENILNSCFVDVNLKKVEIKLEKNNG